MKRKGCNYNTTLNNVDVGGHAGKILGVVMWSKNISTRDKSRKETTEEPQK